MLHLGPHFSRDLYTGRQSATVQILIDGRNSNTALIALNYMQNICDHWRGFDDFLSFGDSTARPSEYVLFFS